MVSNGDRLLIMIPAWNEAGNIAEVIGRLKKELPDTDLLVIDDGSEDDTAAICKGLGVPVAGHRVNLGLAEAVRTGMKYAIRHGYAYCMQFDADGQHDEKSVSKMLKTAKNEKAGIVIGSRFKNTKRGFGAKGLGSRIISACIGISGGVKIADPTSGMRLFDRHVMEKYVSSTHFSPEPDMLAYFAHHKVKIAEVQVEMNERISGKSYLDMTGSLAYMFRMCTSILVMQWLR
ncbi:MAG: glycosyltransferase family 2 protein [Lachnospiraceae bacterium]|nr:glycosyltransferase family 2 protein [Lachnospiraceae bacterium]